MWRRLFIVSVFLITAPVRAEDGVSSGNVEQEVQPDRLQLYVAPMYSLFSREGNTLNGLDINLGMNYALDDRLAIEGGAHQAFSFSGFSAMYSTLELGLSFAVWGSQIRHRRKVKVSGLEVATGVESTQSALIVGAMAKQYFFNGSSSVLPFSGLGISVLYRLPSTTTSNLGVGVSTDFIANGSRAALAFKVFGRWSFWM